MRIPIRATYRRAEKPGGRATLESAVYADVPDALILGTTAQVAADLAMRAGNEDAVVKIRRAIDRACEDGKLMIMD